MRFTPIAIALAGLVCLQALPTAQTDLDAFMKHVMEKRGDPRGRRSGGGANGIRWGASRGKKAWDSADVSADPQFGVSAMSLDRCGSAPL